MTFCVHGRRPALANPRAWEICRAIFDRLDQWTILAAVAMPDHLHLLTAPRHHRDASVSAFTKWFKRWFNEAYWKGDDRTWRWQEGCFDRLLRTGESFSGRWEYLRQNPVRAGLVKHPEDWSYQFQYNTNASGV